MAGGAGGRRISVLIGSRSGGVEGAPGTATLDKGLASLPASDRAAVALAVGRLGGWVQAYCRPGDEEARRYALAAGAAGASSAADPEIAEFDVLLAGEGGAGDGGDLVLAQLAERRGCALVFEVLDVEEDRDELVVTRDLGRGARELLRVKGAAALGVSAQAPRRGYVSHYRRLAAGKAAAGEPRAAAAGARTGAGARDVCHASATPGAEAAAGPWGPARPRAKTADLAARTQPPATQRMLALMGVAGGEGGGGERAHLIEADPETCARHLLRYLAHHGFIERSMTPPAEQAAASERAAESARRTAVMEGNEAGRAAALRSKAEPAPRPAGKLGRGPRPAGQDRPSRVRGPYGLQDGAQSRA